MVVSFLAGGHRFCVDATQVRAMQCAQSSVRQYTAEEIFGLRIDTYGEVGFHSTLMIRHRLGDIALRVMDPVQIDQLASKSIFPLPALISACCQCRAARALVLTDQGSMVLMDIHKAIDEALHREI